MESLFGKRLEDHIANEEKRFEVIAGDIRAIRENHLTHIAASVARLEANYDWLKWGICLIIGGMVAIYFKK